MSNFFPQDTAGQERFHALGPIYYRDANGLFEYFFRSFFQKKSNFQITFQHILKPIMKSPQIISIEFII